MTVLHTSRLTLRPARAADLDDFHAIMRDPVAMRYWSTPPHPDRATTATWLDRDIGHTPVTVFVLEHEGRVIGKAGGRRLPEIGFILHPEYWRQGLVREAMDVIIPHLFATCDLARLTADADPRNAASIGLLTALGFAETHRARNTFCINGEWVDSVYLALSRPS